MLVWVYLLSSLLCWLAAVVMMARFNSAGADIAQSYLLITILAAILGGIDPYGGFGRIVGLFVALLHPAGDRQRLQPHGPQPASRAGLLGRDPAPGRRDKASEIRLRPGSPAGMMIEWDGAVEQ